MAATAASSPIRPLTMMKGRSTNPLRLSNPSAANELKAGMEWSEMTRSQLRPSSAASMSAEVSTRSQVGSYPPLRNLHQEQGVVLGVLDEQDFERHAHSGTSSAQATA